MYVGIVSTQKRKQKILNALSANQISLYRFMMLKLKNAKREKFCKRQ